MMRESPPSDKATASGLVIGRAVTPKQRDASAPPVKKPSPSREDVAGITGRSGAGDGFGRRLIAKFGDDAGLAAAEFDRIASDPNDPANAVLDADERAGLAEIERRIASASLRRAYDKDRESRGLPAAAPAPFRSKVEVRDAMNASRKAGLDPHTNPEFLARFHASPEKVRKF